MKKSIIVMFILMILSFILSAVFFFNSGLFDFQLGQVTKETANALSTQLDNLIKSKF